MQLAKDAVSIAERTVKRVSTRSDGEASGFGSVEPLMEVSRPRQPVPLSRPPQRESRQQLSGGKVLLFTAHSGDSSAFYVQSACAQQVRLTLDFRGSVNLVVEPAQPTEPGAPVQSGVPELDRLLTFGKGRDPLVVSAVALPRERALVCRTRRLVAPPLSSHQTYKYAWRLGAPGGDSVKRRALTFEQREAQQRCGPRHPSGVDPPGRADTSPPVQPRVRSSELAQMRKSLDALPPHQASDERAIRAALKGAGLAFIDVHFPPTITSITGLDSGQPADKQTWWKRPDEFLTDADGGRRGEPRVFSHSVAPGDVQQGSLGNCWFMCSLCALAEYPPLVHSLFTSNWRDESEPSLRAAPTCDPDGFYELRLCKNGQWTDVRVDDLIPCHPGIGTRPKFSQAVEEEMWVLLVEKAFAKLHGCYHALRTGMCFEALADLTGAPTLYRRFSEAPVEFGELLFWERNNCLICCSTAGVDTVTEGGIFARSRGGGLVPGHAYTVISAVQLSRGPYKGEQLLKLRNPWADYEWDGA